MGMNNTAPIKTGDAEEPQVHKEINPEGVAEQLSEAKQVMIIPGYGMAVARAQSQVASIAKLCIDNGVKVRFGIHPVAGRMPGQMNVLLAEAGVPYDWVFELDEVNDDMGDIDVCLVVGANDITNIAAKETEGCPIYGMPVFSVWDCKSTIFKRSMRAGYADLPNPCFYKENAHMCLGNADKTCDEIAAKVKGLFALNGGLLEPIPMELQGVFTEFIIACTVGFCWRCGLPLRYIASRCDFRARQALATTF